MQRFGAPTDVSEFNTPPAHSSKRGGETVIDGHERNLNVSSVRSSSRFHAF